MMLSIDGTDSQGNLTGDGKRPPFYVFDSDLQDWRGPAWPSRRLAALYRLWLHGRIFLLGMFEFRRMLTSHFGYPEIEIYDSGRDLAHRLTLRLFEES